MTNHFFKKGTVHVAPLRGVLTPDPQHQERTKVIFYKLSAVLLLIGPVLIPGTGHRVYAANCTNAYDTGAAVPDGFAVPWDTQHEDRSVVFYATSCTSEQASMQVSNSANTAFYAYHTGYYWTGSAWQAFALTGVESVGSAWYLGSATGTIPVVGKTTYAVAYTCQYVDGTWKCGCTDAECNTSSWQLQGVVSENDTGVAAACDTATPPPAALAAGYTELEFCSDFDSIDELDIASSQCPDSGSCEATKPHDKLWYLKGKPFGNTATLASEVSVADSVLTLANSGNGFGIMTAFKVSGGGLYTGYVAGPSYYAEARIRINEFPPTTEACYTWKSHWPAFWSMDTCHLYQNCREYLELDYFEYLECRDGAKYDAYGAAIHDWLALDQWGEPCDPVCHTKRVSNQWAATKVGYFGDTNPAGDNRGVKDLGWFDWDRSFHTVGMFVRSQDSIDVYADDALKKTNDMKPGGQFTYMDIPDDTERYPLILGSATDWPMDVDWVRVWVQP